MLEKVRESRGVLNLSLFKTSNECHVLFDTDDDVRSIAGSLPREEQRDIYTNGHKIREQMQNNTNRLENMIRYKSVQNKG